LVAALPRTEDTEGDGGPARSEKGIRAFPAAQLAKKILRRDRLPSFALRNGFEKNRFQFRTNFERLLSIQSNERYVCAFRKLWDSGRQSMAGGHAVRRMQKSHFRVGRRCRSSGGHVIGDDLQGRGPLYSATVAVTSPVLS